MESAGDFIQRKQQEPLRVWRAKDIGRQGYTKRVTEARTFMVQSNLPEKVYMFERKRQEGLTGNVTHPRKGSIEYRIGYFIVGKNGNAQGRWTWGQYCPLIPAEDFWKLIALARKEGTKLADVSS